MKKVIFFAFAAFVAVTACTNEDHPVSPSVNGDKVTFTADFNDAVETKVSAEYDGDLRKVTVKWDKGDQVGIYADTGAPVLYKATTSGSSTTLVSESELADAETYYAVYPYAADAVLDNGSVIMTLPSEQVASTESFTAHLAVAATTGTTMSFANVAGLVKVVVSCDFITSIEFKGNSDEVVAGDIVVNVNDATYQKSINGDKTITITPPAGMASFARGSYYFPILPQTFEKGFTVTAKKCAGTDDIRVVNTNVVVPRSSLVVGKPFTDNNLILGGEFEADDAQYWLEDNVYRNSANYPVEYEFGVTAAGWDKANGGCLAVKKWFPLGDDAWVKGSTRGFLYQPFEIENGHYRVTASFKMGASVSTPSMVCVRYYFAKEGVYREGTTHPDFHGAAQILRSDVYYYENQEFPGIDAVKTKDIWIETDYSGKGYFAVDFCLADPQMPGDYYMDNLIVERVN